MRSKWKKKPLYIASFLKDDVDDYGNQIPVYNEAVYYGLQNIQPLSTTQYGVEAVGFGDKVIKMQKVLLDYDTYLGKINERDVAYLDGITPDSETSGTYGSNANYRVVAVRNQNKKILVYFEKLPNK